MRMPKSHGSGAFRRSQFAGIGKGVVIEKGVLVFHPENIEIGDNVYIGHHAIIKGYYRNRIKIGSGTWIGQQCFFHGAGGLIIGNNVGIGPAVKIVTSSHKADDPALPVLHTAIVFEDVVIGDDCDIGTGAVILPGVTIGKGSVVGAGAIVTKDIPTYSIAVGNPAKVIKKRR